MTITVNGQSFKLNRKEVAEAKKLALEQIRICREKIDVDSHPSFYITYLLMLHLMSQDALNELDAEKIKNALQLLNGRMQTYPE